MNEIPSFIGAFTAGLLSFFSPCVLPLLPSYLIFLTGSGAAALRSRETSVRRLALTRTVSFVLGFSVVFIALGLILSSAQALLGGPAVLLRRISGGIIILLGLNMAFNISSLLNRTKRANFGEKPRGWLGAVLVGAAFGAGWSPCIGPILASILLLAAQGSSFRAAALLSVYSAGFALPFFIFALFFAWAERFSKKILPYTEKIRLVSGLILAAIGLWLLF